VTDSPSGAWSGLARKYAALAALRARRDGAGPPATRGELRELAAEFPGCLRELDTLGRDELVRRATLMAAAAAGGVASEPWMHWIAAYHEAMRQALAARAPGPGGDGQVGKVGRTAGPEGRLNVTILRSLASHFGVPAETIAHTLFPVRRRSPYQL
jgi:hypothetical protein